MRNRDIEALLRQRPPDEPLTLPPLLLPAASPASVRAGRVRFRLNPNPVQGQRLVYLVVALALVASALIVAGALRMTVERLTEPHRFVYRPQLDGDPAAFELRLPDGWQVAQEGELFPGDFLDPMLSYERVVLVATTNLAVGCPTSRPGPVLHPLPSGGEPVEIPRATRDPGLDCILGAPLPQGSGRLSIAIGTRSWGTVADDGPAIIDLAEPIAENGWTVSIGGQPARTITDVELGKVVAVESQTWDAIVPGQIDRVMRVVAELRGDAAERASLWRQVEDLIASIQFLTSAPPLDAATAEDRLRDVVERFRTDLGSDFAACMPMEPGRRSGVMTTGIWEPLPEPVDVICESRIEASAAGVWRITLTATWPATDDYTSGGLMYSLFVRGDGELVVGYPQAADGSWFGSDGERPYLPLPRSDERAVRS